MIEKFLTTEEVETIEKQLVQVLNQKDNSSYARERIWNALNLIKYAASCQERTSITRSQFATMQDNINHISRHLQEQTHPNKCLVVSTAAIYETLIEVSANG